MEPVILKMCAVFSSPPPSLNDLKSRRSWAPSQGKGRQPAMENFAPRLEAESSNLAVKARGSNPGSVLISHVPWAGLFTMMILNFFIYKIGVSGPTSLQKSVKEDQARLPM